MLRKKLNENDIPLTKHNAGFFKIFEDIERMQVIKNTSIIILKLNL